MKPFGSHPVPDEFAKRWVGGIKEEAEEVRCRGKKRCCGGAPGTGHGHDMVNIVVHNMVHNMVNRC